MALRCSGAQSLAAGRASALTGHAGRSPGFVMEHEAVWIEIGLALEPCLARGPYARAVLLRGMGCLALSVRSRASRTLRRLPSPTVRACSSRSRARISSWVMSSFPRG
jgi:hypothetical protein